MAYRILLPTATYLEGNFKLNFELNNQVFSTSDASVLPGSFSFPADVPLTNANKAALGNPHLVTNARNWQTFEGVWVELYGVKMFYGTLKITSCSQRSAKVNIVANPVAALKKLKLNQLDLGGERDHDGYLTWSLLMFNTTVFPEDWDFVFVPMYQAERNGYVFDSGDPDNLVRPFYNRFEVSPSLEFDMASGALVPFPKLEYLLQQIFAAENTGYTFVNAWQTSLELRRLYIFNNWDMRAINTGEEPDLPSTINLANHVPAIAATELLKKVIAHFCLGLFTNVFSRTLRLVPLQTILQRPPARDWTAHVVSPDSLDAADTPPLVFNYEQPGELPHGVPAPEDIATVFNTLPDFNAALPLDDGYYYIETEMMIVQVDNSWPFQPRDAWLQHRGVVIGDGERLDTGMETLLHINYSYLYNAPVVASRFYEGTDENGDPVWERQTTEPPVAVFFYRGYNDVALPQEFPVASNHVWAPENTGGDRLDITVNEDAVATAERSLNWFGDYGLFETAHKTWAYMLRDGKHVTLQLALPVADLVAFSFEDKIRVLNMDYFVKKLKVGKPLGRGKVLVEASLVSVI
jgi:hypothetical protein